MIQSIKRPNVNYREIKALNSSMLKLFDSDPVKFFEQFKLGKKRKNLNSTSIVIGDIVDFYLLDCKGDEDEFDQRWDEKFAVSTVEKGSGQVFFLTDILYDLTEEDTNLEGEIKSSFETRFSQAFKMAQAAGKYKGGKEEKALIDFNENAKTYFSELTENSGKTVVSPSLVDKSKYIAKFLMEDEYTKNLFKENLREEMYSKFPIEWKYRGIECKSEVDLIRINHTLHRIYLFDLKTTYDNENFEYSYIKHGYYIQAGFYYLAVKEWAKENGMEAYTIVPMEFIVADTSSNSRRPIRYQTSQKDLEASIKGFTLKGIYYKGVDEIITEILWAEETNSWNCSKEVFDNDGILKLKLGYE